MRSGLKHDSLLWYDNLHQAQDKATISLELNDSFACSDWKINENRVDNSLCIQIILLKKIFVVHNFVETEIFFQWKRKKMYIVFVIALPMKNACFGS